MIERLLRDQKQGQVVVVSTQLLLGYSTNLRPARQHRPSPCSSACIASSGQNASMFQRDPMHCFNEPRIREEEQRRVVGHARGGKPYKMGGFAT